MLETLLTLGERKRERNMCNARQIRLRRQRTHLWSIVDRNHVVMLLCYLLIQCTHTCMAFSPRFLRELNEEVERRGPHEEEKQRESTMTDVWLCLACALGWTVWMVAAHIRPIVQRYATEGSVVYGNVLQSTVEIGAAIPTYRAVVDYVLEDEATTQVRKEFRTDTRLEEGFANVELLVLPGDPTSGVLKKDWEGEYAEHLETEEARKSGRKWTLILGAVLVTISLVGAAKAVERLPVEMITWGWVSFVAGVALLWPVAILLYANGNVISNLACQSKQEKGIVIRGDEPRLAFSLNPITSMDTNDGIVPVEAPKEKKVKTVKPPAIELSRICTRHKNIVMPPHLRVKINDESVAEDQQRFGCYFINLPFIGKRTSSHKSRPGSGSISSVSSASVSPNGPQEQHHPPSLDKDVPSTTRQIV